MTDIPFDRVLFLSTTIEEIQKSIQKIKGGCLRERGLRCADLMCLWVLGKHPDGLTATELSHECRLDKALISRAVKKLASIGAVFYDKPAEREGGGQSHRRRNYRIRLKLTREGGDMSKQLVGVAEDAAATARCGMDSREMEQLCMTLSKLNENLKEYLQRHAVAFEDAPLGSTD